MGIKDSHTTTNWLKDNYGSKRGLVQNFWHRLLQVSGVYNQYQQPEFENIKRLVFVCKGNICRSAFAEAVARSINIKAISCGLDTIEGATANDDAIRTATEMGFNMEEHRTTPFEKIQIREGDLLVAMEPWHAEKLGQLVPQTTSYTLLGLWTKPKQPYIHDPYGSSPNCFRNCFHLIQNSVYGLAKKIK